MIKLICTVITVFLALSSVPTYALELSAESAIVIEASTGRVVYESNPDARRSPASTTKIMTALVALESGDTSREIEVSPEAVGVEGSSVYLEAGEKVTLDALIRALLLESANDAAAAIAIAVSGSIDAFAVKMNEKAAELGLESTHFTNPHGLYDENHYTTARELAILASKALENDAFREIVSTYRDSVEIGGESRFLLNHNKLLKLYDGAIGVKTGYTKKSGRCLVSAAERDGLRLIAVTLGAPDDWNDHAKMLDLGFETLERRELIRPGESVFIQPCIGSEGGDCLLANRDGLSVVVERTTPEIVPRVELVRYFWAPLTKGKVVGRIVFEADGICYGEVPIEVCENVGRICYEKGILERIFG